jgi:deoxyadenosine/deoxycytidine kinase
LPYALAEFPWKKDEKLYKEAKSIPRKRFYEQWTIYAFGFLMGVTAARLEKELKVPLEKFPFDLVFRSEYPDAILVNENTKETLNVEFEEFSSLFHEHGHNPKKCDLIICVEDDWNEEKLGKRPVDIYEIVSGELHNKSER